MVLQTVQTFATSHLLQLRFAVQLTHPVPEVKLQVEAVAQQPCELAGSGKKFVLQSVHWFEESHLSQFKVDGQETQPILFIPLKV